MALHTGLRIGPYEIVAPLGAGGMGEVYRARDTNLNRDVALKILPESFAADGDRVARFKREAQVLASLNHPNIAAIYGIEKTSGVDVISHALVMELVEGDDLSTLIDRSRALETQGALRTPHQNGASGLQPRGLSVADALPIARQIIDALEAAHEQGIVHRDLKPQNIKIRHDGTVKVLDFGLAKAIEPVGRGFSRADPGVDGAAKATPYESPTMTSPAMTAMGLILGTAPYMSPEQARGRPVDKRTDVWALGCILFEMLTGKRTFDGEDATDIISAIVKTEPDWSVWPATAPAYLKTIVMRCLVKDRKARIPDVSVIRYLLDDVNSQTGALVPVSPSPNRTLWWKLAAAALTLTTVGAGVAWYLGRALPPASAQFLVNAPGGTTITAGGFLGGSVPALSPDGRLLAFTAIDRSGKRQIWLRAIDALTAQPIAGTDGAAFPFWSPDSRTIGYSVVGKLMKVPATGGVPFTICTLNPGIVSRGGTWNSDDVIVFNNGPALLYQVPAAGGTATPIGTLLEGEVGRQFPSFLPGGRQFLYSGTGPAGTGAYVSSLDGTGVTSVTAASSGAVYSAATGHIVFARQTTLFAQRFDVRTLEVTGDPVPIAEGLSALDMPGLVSFSVSDDGTLAYGVGGATSAGLQLAWVDRTGRDLGIVGPQAQYRGINLSPNERQVVAHRHEGEGGDLWVTDLVGESRNTTRLTFDTTQENGSAVWSPTGDRVAYSSVRGGLPGIYIRRADNGGTEQLVLQEKASRFIVPFGWSANGTALIFGNAVTDTGRDLWMVASDGQSKAVPVLNSRFGETYGQVSPDGRWLAYVSDETGANEVYVQHAPAALGGSGAPGKWPVSSGGGTVPRWRADSREIYYLNEGKLLAVPVTLRDGTFVAGVATPLFDVDRLFSGSAHSLYFPYAVADNGRKFLLSRRVDTQTDGAPSSIAVVLHWREPRS